MTNWRTVRFKKVVTLKQGMAFNSKNNHLIVDEGIPLLRIVDLKNNSETRFVNRELVSDRFISNSTDLIYSRTGQLGLVFTNRVGVVHNNCFRVIPNKEIDHKYLYWYLKQPSIIEHARSIASGAAQPDLNHDAFKSIPFTFPDLPTQRKIASILSAYDDLIENNNQRIQLLEEMAEEIYKEWFVRMRFPSYKETKFFDEDGKEVSHGTRGALPEGWEIVRVSDAFDIMGGGTPSTEQPGYWDGSISWFSPTDITGTKGIYPHSSRKITELGLKKSSAKMFPPKSVMMTSRATIGAVGINLEEACTNQGFITCIPNENFTYLYIYEWIKLNRRMFENFSSGATFKEISRGVFKRLKILKPSLFASKEFWKMTEPIFNELNILQAKNQLLQETRDLLLPRLISGKLSVDHIKLEEASELSP